MMGGLNYPQGLATLKLLVFAGNNDEGKKAALNFEARLMDNLHREALFDSTEEIRAERARILYQLNALALRYGQEFNDMCRNLPRVARPAPVPDLAPVSSTSIVDILPVVSRRFLTHTIPTSYSSLLDRAHFPLVTIEFDNTGLRSQDFFVKCEATIEGYCQSDSSSASIPKGTTHKVILFPSLLPEKIKTLNVSYLVNLRVLIEYTFPSMKCEDSHDERVTLQARSIALLAQKGPHDWIDLTEYLAAWVTPHHHEIGRLVNVAAKYLPLLAHSFPGYTNAGSTPAEIAENIRDRVQAIFKLLKQDKPLTYIDTSFDPEPHEDQMTQRVRLPSETLSLDGSANCLDGTLLFASLLEAASIAPLILLVPGHALVGWKIFDNKKRKESYPYENELYEFLETTAIRFKEFSEACEAGQRLYDDAYKRKLFDRELNDPRGSARLIDVAVCRRKGIRPLE